MKTGSTMKTLIFICFNILFLNYLFPQTTFTTYSITTDADGAERVFATDIDGDGDVDILYSAKQEDKLGLYLNDGSENFTDVSINTDMNSTTDIEAVDLDGDGDIDIISTDYSGTYNISWHSNDGSENFTSYSISNTIYGPSDIEVIDLDGDGDNDLIVACTSSDKVVWFENDGSESFTEHEVASNMENTREVAVVDLDDDGDLDILSTAEEEDKVYWHENDGSESFTTTVISSDVDGAWCVDAADMDNDGDVDIVVTGVVSSSQAAQVVWFENDGSESFTSHELTTTYYPEALHLVDIDNDTYTDIVTLEKQSMNYNKIIWYQNSASQTFTKNNLFIGTDYYFSPQDVYAADVDSDGNVDLVSASYHDDRISWHKNVPPYSGPVWYVSTTGSDSNEGSVDQPFAAIQTAIDSSSAGDTVLVAAGTYVENINFNGKSITVIGDSESPTTIDGGGSGFVVTFPDVSVANTPTLTGFTIRNGYAVSGWGDAGGGGIYCGENTTPSLTNLIITGNTGPFGAGIWFQYTDPTLTNVTLSNNTANFSSGAGIFGNKGADLTLVNCILWNNTPYEISFYEFNDPNSVDVYYSDIQGGQDGIVLNDNGTVTWGSGNIDVNPMFVDTANGNYHLLASSMLINAGHPDSTDSDGTRADIGAYPYLNTYSGPTWYVQTDGSDTDGTGASSSPFASIQSAINFATTDGDSVTVSEGTYVENLNFRGRNIKVVGGDQETTIIDGGADTTFNDASGVVVFNSFETSAALLDGFTIQNGTSFRGGGLLIYDSSPTIENLIIKNNSALAGGGVHIQTGNPNFNNVDFLNNVSTGHVGGALAVCCGSQSIFTNCTFTGNQSGGWGPPTGGGVYVEGASPDFINVNFYGNSSTTTGIGGYGLVLSAGSTVDVTNSIFKNNNPDQIAFREDGESNSLTVAYSNIQGGQDSIVTNNNGIVTWGSGNIDLDPRFVDTDNDDYHLADWSPCIGTGLDTSIVSSTDIEGNPRPNPAGSNPDMGAYENSLGAPIEHIVITTDTLLVTEDSLATVDFRENDLVLNVSSLVLSILDSSSHGTISVAGDTMLTYTPMADFFGFDTVQYALSGTTAADTGFVFITVVNEDDMPVVVNAIPDITVNEDAPDSLLANLDVVFMDIDDELEYSHVIVDTTLVFASVTNDSVSLQFLPDANGSTNIIFTATNPTIRASVSDTMIVTIVPVNDTPVLTAALPDVSIDEDDFGAIIIPALEVYFNDVDEGDILSFTGSALGEGLDSLSFSTDDGFNAMGRMSNYHGTKIMTIKRSELKQRSSSKVFAPQRIDKNKSGRQFTKSFSSVNDIIDTRQNRSLSRTDSTALIVYPTENFVGDVEIRIVASDTTGESVADTLKLTIANINDAPFVANAIADIEVDEDSEPITVAINGVFDDADILVGDSLTITAQSLADTLVTVEYDSNSVPMLVFAENGNGETDIIVTAADLGGLTVSDTVHVTILPVNDAPAMSALADTTIDEDATIEIVLTASDIDEDTLTFSAAADTNAVIVAMNTDTLSVSLVDNWNGSSSIMVVVSDGSATDTTSFELTVNAVNDAPSSFALNEQDSVYITMANFDSDSIVFAWDESADVDDDELTYHFTAELVINGQLTTEYDTTLTANALKIDYQSVFDEIYAAQAMLAAIEWDVSVSDGVEEVMAENGPLTVGVNASDAVLSINEELLPEKFALHQNYPNPFNPVTTLRYDLPEQANVNIIIYDMLGRQVRTLLNQTQDAGYRSVIWNATNDYGKPVSAGVYLYKIQAGEFVQTRKMVLLK
uniref:Putative FG-GAP repeat protein n=1 Tax=uncultured marine microorganism HF4000_ANIW141I9 TaxID=455537 RepID=B3T5F6_9ZZZZ|nr:putative FG-GAP repeat protein [uncultured marine microorganism HF4000_ANIW141I9]